MKTFIAISFALCSVAACAVGDNTMPVSPDDDTAEALALITAAPGSETHDLSMFDVVPSDSAHPGAVFTSGSWKFNNTGIYMYYPLDINTGDVITGYSWVTHKTVTLGSAVASIVEIDNTSATVLALSGSQQGFTGTSGTLTIGTNAMSYTTLPGKTYALRVATADGTNGADWFTNAQLFVTPIL